MPTKKAEVEIAPKRRILVFQREKSFVITVPEDAKTTFGPWVPPGMRSYGSRGDSVGTLRVYGRTEKHILGVFSGVSGFRDLSLEYVEVEADMLGGVEEDSEVITGLSALVETGPLPSPHVVTFPDGKRGIDFVDPDEEDQPF